jgi:triphosphoribosyl-dephospho-CoA synthetase
MSAGTPHWWEDATAEEAAGGRGAVRAFLTSPNSADREKFARAFALLILLGEDGDYAGARDEISKVEDLHLDEICNGLKVLEKRLSDFPAALPNVLRTSIAQLEERSQRRSHDYVAEKQEKLRKQAESKPRPRPGPKD